MTTVDKNVADGTEIASAAVWERETARRALLTQLGLTPLTSRYDPEGAMPARRFVAPAFEVGGEMSSPQGEASSDMGEMQGAQLRAMLRNEVDGEPPAVSDAPGVDHRESIEPNARPRLERLSLLTVVSEDVLWIEQLEDHLLRQEQLHLVVAMARAIRGSAVHCEHQLFDWPPSGGITLSNQDVLEDMLSGFLQRLITDHGSQLVIQLGSVDVLPGLAQVTNRIPSSLTMLQDPSTKREAWSVLKSLANRR